MGIEGRVWLWLRLLRLPTGIRTSAAEPSTFLNLTALFPRPSLPSSKLLPLLQRVVIPAPSTSNPTTPPPRLDAPPLTRLEDHGRVEIHNL